MNKEENLKLRNLVLLLGSTLAILTSIALSPALPNMLKTFQNIDNAEILVKLVLTLPSLFILIGAPVAGILLDKWGRKPVLIISLILYGVSGVSGYFFDSLMAILISRAFLGMATGGIMSGFSTLIGDYFSGEKLNKFVGLQGAYMGVGGMIYSIVGGYLVDSNWRYVFFLHLIAVFILLGVLFAIREPKREIRREEDTIEEKNLDYPKKAIMGIYFLTIIGSIGYYIIPVFLPFFLNQFSDVSSAQVGQFLSIPTITSLIIAINYQKIKSKVSFAGLMAICFLVMGITFLLYGSALSLVTVAIGQLVAGIGLGLMYPTLNIWVLSLSPVSMRGRLMGGLTTAIFLGQFLTPIAVQPLVDQSSLGESFRTVGIIALIIYVIFLFNAYRNKTKKLVKVAS